MNLRIPGPTPCPEDVLQAGAQTLCRGLASSKAEAKRLVSQGAVEVDGERVTDVLPIHDGAIVKVGKRKFVRLVEDKG